MIRLLVSDVDGTLLNSRREVSEVNRAALWRAYESGITICLATGRLVPTLEPIAEQVGIPGPRVTCNGAFAESADREVLFEASLGDRARDLILDYAGERAVNVNIYQPFEVFASHESRFLELYRGRTKRNPEILGWEGLKSKKASKMIFILDPDDLQSHMDHFVPFCEEFKFDLTVSESEYLEFLPQGANKATALQAVAADLGVERHEVAAVGDYMNDLEMVEWAGLGGAMASGVAELVARADVVVPSHDEDGLAWFVDLVLERNSRS